ncbi:serine O-acetyltransferase [Paenibacillus sinopodophylli]|uniref:serine O-acetyltransferase n=1 Tax=Paenibacillus sinopodophylli TaxID=1837342 RepID=UPI00110C98F1|nr:serine acetyltransferase [Paenibacillus sinopodophylli]
MSKNFHEQIDLLVSTIAASHREVPLIISVDSHELPNKDTVIEIIHLLRELLFPGYFGRQNISNATMEYRIGEVLIEVHKKLSEQIDRVLSHHNNRRNEFSGEVKQSSEKIVCEFLSKIPMLRNVLATDVQAAFDGDPSANDTDEIIFSYPGIFAVSVYRLAHELYLLSVPLLPRIMSEYAHSLTGIDIHAGATIGSWFFIDHGTGVVIGETTIIGNRVKIYHGVTLGALSTRGGQALYGMKRHPTLEDEVTVYSGASILGGDTVIGKAVVIGSNVFISKSVPAGAKVTVKNPELVIKGSEPQEFKQESIIDWVI